MERLTAARLAIILFCGVPAIFGLACSRSGVNGGGQSSSGTVGVAFACENPAPSGCERSFTYKLTPGALTGSSGTKTTYTNSQPSQTQTATTQVNGVDAAIFSWVVPTTLAYGSWTLTVSDDTRWTGTCQITMSSSSPTAETHFDNTSSQCTTGDANLATYP
jgi:hypothetical protein